ncbi:AmmeMemoRadiSam system radical SAM enzyme [Butyrivibrio proteoclasticus]|uniref:AmmeMemoRadiSam system radical SAM enzyme n=1 Tax=Butyrivibrio proteoclasticus TaxID=43305 RepID=UPI00047C8A57|nr:AmmeMemoRadiSam system radical SAM enzyme [Butyrivibrio proteoclasticus]
MPRCDVCHNRCNLNEGDVGLCRARKFEDGSFKCANYGLVTSIALDPIEKKPLNLFYPGSNIISVGSYGCNLRCPFCQNHEISYGFGKEFEGGARFIAPSELAEIAESYIPQGNIGVAFTYNEPLVGYEYVIDTAKEVHERGLKTVLVSNGCVSQKVAELVIPHIDAMNIDLKGFTDSYYEDVLHGNRRMVMDFIEHAAGGSHVEVTTLIVPGYNDSDTEMEELAGWISKLDNGNGREKIALHISRYFPRFRMTDIPATDLDKIYHLREIAGKYLDHVFTGNC